MLIKKGGVYREIEPKNFELYRQKGYAQVLSGKAAPKNEKKGAGAA